MHKVKAPRQGAFFYIRKGDESMKLPFANMKNNVQIQTMQWLGLDERDKIGEEQFLQMKNLSSDKYPCLSPRKPRKEIDIDVSSDITNLVLPKYSGKELSKFTGIAGRYFYYEGVRKGTQLSDDIPKTVVDFYGRICIFPDKKYYSYLPDSSENLEDMEVSETGKMKFYSNMDEYGDNYSAYIQNTDADWDEEQFKSGDSVVIEGSGENDTFVVESKFQSAGEEDIVSVVVEKVDGNRLYVRLYNKNGKAVEWNGEGTESNITVKKPVPNMRYVCVHNNRLWGCGEPKDGDGKQYGEFIYASKLGDPFNFNTFQGLSTDSWYGSVGTEGEFTGIAAYRNMIVVFKRNYIHHVYGDMPSSFSIPKQIAGSCIDYRSIVEIDGILYYLGKKGYYAYNGGTPQRISDNLTQIYTEGVAGTDGVKYYACSYRADKSADLLVYDPRYGLWHREDDTGFVGFVTVDQDIYGATDGKMYLLSGGTEDVEWSVTSKRFTLDTMMRKAVNQIYLRLDMPPGSKVTVYTRADGGEWKEWGTIEEDGFRTHRVPVRFRDGDYYQIRLDGAGDVTIHDMETEVYAGAYNVR